VQNLKSGAKLKTEVRNDYIKKISNGSRSRRLMWYLVSGRANPITLTHENVVTLAKTKEKFNHSKVAQSNKGHNIPDKIDFQVSSRCNNFAFHTDRNKYKTQYRAICRAPASATFGECSTVKLIILIVHS
jgi:hypothetical protein